MLTLTEVRYWYFHIPPEKQNEVQTTIGFTVAELEGNSIYEQIRDVYKDEIIAWYE